MLHSLCQAAPAIHAGVLFLMAAAIIAGFIADRAGTRRISIVLAAVTLIFLLLPRFSAWPQYEQWAHIIVNSIAWAPLLIHPKTSRQQVIAGCFIANGAVHAGFYCLAPEWSGAALIEWYASISIDAVQAALVLWWSGPHVRKALGLVVRRRDGLARNPTHYGAR